MAPLTNVAPYTLTPSNRLLSILKPVSSIPSDAIHSDVKATIPVLSSIDVSDIISANTQKLLTKKSLETKKIAIDEESVEDITHVNEEPQKYVDVKTLLPQNKKDQLTIVLIQNFPNLRRIAIEKLLNVFIPSEYSWSQIGYDFIDNKVLYIKFDGLKAVKRFHTFNETIPEIFNSASVKYDPELLPLLEKIEIDTTSINLKVVTAKVNQILQSSWGKSLKSGTEDLDAVLNYYSKYKVDNNELIDVPNNMKDVIVKDIIKFRSKVLIMERENRKKEIEQERVKTKERLKQVFQGLQNEDVTMTEPSSAASHDNSIVGDEREEMNEQEYEAHLRNERDSNLSKAYKEKLSEMKKLENEKRILEQQLEKLNSYEGNLIDNKFKLIEDIISIQDQDGNCEQPHLSNDNSFAALFNLYHSNHSQYLKTRTQKRTYEETQDKLDRETEKKEIQSNEQATDFIANMKKTKVEEVEMPESVEIIIKDLDEKTTNLLQTKIIELVEEYLGIKDNLLIDVINDNLKKNNLDKKQDLVKDLAEVLDEDASILVDDLWKFISSSL